MTQRLIALASPALLAACSSADAPVKLGVACEPSTETPVALPGGRFTIGEDPRYLEEGPPREVTVPPFMIDRQEVTNGQFARFVAATGYVTEAERRPPVIAGAPPEMALPGSAVFTVPDSTNPNWWRWRPGASWRAPEGPGSSTFGREREPVTQVTFADAKAYAGWAGGDLPTEEQWEYAARGGEPAAPKPVDAAGNPTANVYQGVFPARDIGVDGFTARAPVGCFGANAFGLFDMIGNVWEWTAGGDSATERAIIKGGSYLCAANYCARYRPAARQMQEKNLGTNHIGFRVAYPAADPSLRR